MNVLRNVLLTPTSPPFCSFTMVLLTAKGVGPGGAGLTDFLDRDFCFNGFHMGWCDDHLPSHQRFRSNCRFTCSGCTVAPTLSPTHSPVSTVPTTPPTFSLPSHAPTKCSDVWNNSGLIDVFLQDKCDRGLRLGRCNGTTPEDVEFQSNCQLTCTGCVSVAASSQDESGHSALGVATFGIILVMIVLVTGMAIQIRRAYRADQNQELAANELTATQPHFHPDDNAGRLIIGNNGNKRAANFFNPTFAPDIETEDDGHSRAAEFDRVAGQVLLAHAGKSNAWGDDNESEEENPYLTVTGFDETHAADSSSDESVDSCDAAVGETSLGGDIATFLSGADSIETSAASIETSAASITAAPRRGLPDAWSEPVQQKSGTDARKLNPDVYNNFLGWIDPDLPDSPAHEGRLAVADVDNDFGEGWEDPDAVAPHAAAAVSVKHHADDPPNATHTSPNPAVAAHTYEVVTETATAVRNQRRANPTYASAETPNSAAGRPTSTSPSMPSSQR